MKAAIYARYSSDNQREESIDAQVRAIKEYCAKNDMQIVKIYIDEAKSATSDDRPSFLQMVKDSSQHWFDVVMVHKLDRFARNRYDSAFYKRILRESGVRLISILEPLDDSPESIILESVLEGMNEYYSANLARETLKGLKENAFECRHNGGIPPLGYDVDPVTKKYVLNEYEARAVKIIFDMCVSGAGYNEIISRLSAMGYKTKRGNSFGKNGIHEILRNEKYTGTYIFNRAPKRINGKYNKRKENEESKIIKIPGGMPEIISADKWLSAQAKLNSRRQTGRTPIVPYVLSGLMYCGVCGGSFVGNTRRQYKDRKKNIYCSYNCSTRQRKGTCNAKGIEKIYIESYVINQVKKSMFSKKSIETLAKTMHRYAKQQSIESSKDIEAFEAELKETEKRINNIAEAVANGMFHMTMKQKMTELEEKRADVLQMIDETKLSQQKAVPSVEQIKKHILKDKNIENESPETQKHTLQKYVKRVIVSPTEIKIEFRVFCDGCGRPYQFINTHKHKK